MSNKRIRPRNKKCQKSRTNTGELATSIESINWCRTIEQKVNETRKLSQISEHLEKHFKSYFKNCFSFAGTSYEFKLLFGVGLWLQLDQKGGKKIENQDFLITFQSGPAVHFSTNHLDRVIKYEQWNQSTVNIAD